MRCTPKNGTCTEVYITFMAVIVESTSHYSYDSLHGTDEDDTIIPGNGFWFNYVYGGAGNDLLVLDFSLVGPFLPTGIWMNFPSPEYTALGYPSTAGVNGEFFGYVGAMSFNIEYVNVIGTDSEDALMGGYGDNNTLFGGASNDTLTSNAFNDSLNGAEGDDLIFILNFGSGMDTIIGGMGVDTLEVYLCLKTDPQNIDTTKLLISGIEVYKFYGGRSQDQITTGSENSKIFGIDGNDSINPGLGLDSVDGGVGTDLLIIDYSNHLTEAVSIHIDTLTADSGYVQSDDGTKDRVDFEHIEELRITGSVQNDDLAGAFGDSWLAGGGGNDSLLGNAGDDRLTGGLGKDLMRGGFGNDTYVVDSAEDRVIEGDAAGIDLIESALTFTLGATLENLTLIGVTAINGTGNSLNNGVFGNSLANRLDGGIGRDSLSGELGDDTYLVNLSSDLVTEQEGEGSDLVFSEVTYTLSAYVENLTLTGAVEVSGFGNSLANRIIGNGATNQLNGGLGADSLLGLK
jgi:Ca2+-binding RTX toxin-like protein